MSAAPSYWDVYDLLEDARTVDNTHMNFRNHIFAASLLLLAVALAGPDTTQAQSNQFRDSRAHLGLAGGLFTFHGPIDLLQPRSGSNFVREHDPAIAVLGSFPITTDRFFFRGMVLFTNFSTKDGRRLVGDGKNEFLTQDIMIFESEVVMTLRAGSRSRFLPYIFTGFGGMLADTFGSTKNAVDLPGVGVPGPERSVYQMPVGIGFDYAFDGCTSAFTEVSYRFDLNYVFRNESNYDPHNTSLVLGGMRFCVKNPFKKAAPPPPAVPPPLDVPAYTPPLPRSVKVCTLVDLNSIYFAAGSTELSSEARRLLDENIEALRLNPTCCVTITGHTDSAAASVYAIRVARQRAEVTYAYYLAAGLSPELFTVDAEAITTPCPKGKGEECKEVHRVESAPFDCSRLLFPNR